MSRNRNDVVMEVLAGQITLGVTADEALKLTQAMLNMAHVISLEQEVYLRCNKD